MSTERPDRRAFLKRGAAVAGGLSLGGAEALGGQTAPPEHQVPPQVQQVPDHESPELVAYGVRSQRVTSVRIAHPPGGRPSPDEFGLTFHIATPLQDQMGAITPSSLHYVGTTRG